MKTLLTLLTATLLGAVLVPGARAQTAGFTDSYVSFYGEVRQIGGAGTVLLQSGRIKMTFASQTNAANRVTIEASLAPTGAGEAKPFSYVLKVPLAFLPEAPRLGEFLAIGQAPTDFKVDSVTINDQPATLPDGSLEFYGLSFANRADKYRLDLLVVGDSTDTDGDGLPDWWERLHGLDPESADATLDSDGDGWSNLEEFRRGSNPAESNLEPALATAEILVPELGEAGCYLHFHDSDTAPADLSLEIDAASLLGFEARLDGDPFQAGATPLTLADLLSGRLTIAHRDPAVREASLPVAWSDGGDAKAGSVRLRAVTPSTSDGNDAALWLDAATLPAGAPLATWSDRSGNGRNAMQPLPESQPAVTTLGRHSTVEFAQPSSHLFFQDAAIPTGDHTILAAWRSEGSRREPQTIFSTNGGFLRLDPTAEPVSYPGAPLYQAGNLAVRGYQSALGPDAVSIFRREGGSLQNIFGLSYNGESIAPETLDPVLPTIGARRLALPVAEPITNAFQGSLHEMLVFPVALHEQKLRDVHDYLQSKWAGYVTWDFSTSLQPVTLEAAGAGRHIIRGGHGNDELRGGDTSNILSGGPGRDTLHGTVGRDTFVFGGVDTGNDVITGFGPDDVIDLSALFWGMSGDARQFLTTRLDTNFSTPVPTLDTVLIVQRPGVPVLEITLRDTVLGNRQVVELIVEGRLRMGSLSIPNEVALALAAGSDNSTVLGESLDDSFTVEITRSGDGVPGALEVPIGLFADALGEDVALEGVASKDGERAVVSFGRGETVKRVTFRPVPDLESEGAERWETAVLPHFRYAVAGGAVARTVSDDPFVRLAVVEANALTSGQPARVRVTRDRAGASPLTVSLELDGTAEEGLHINSVPRSLTIPAGQAFAEVAITTAAGWDGARPCLALLRVVADAGYNVGDPHEATVYAAGSATDADAAGFERWLTAASDGAFTSLLDLLQSESAARINDYVRAYAQGHASPETAAGPGLSFRLVENRPELRARVATAAADLRWQVQSSGDGSDWRDVSAAFAQDLAGESLTLLGPPRQSADARQLYRLAFSVESGAQLEAGLDRLTGSDRYGLAGAASWQADPRTGQLVSTAAASGAVSRLIVQVESPTLLEFDMAVQNGDGADRLRFFIDGVSVAETSGATVRVERQIEPADPVLLMWEFRRSTGNAVLGNALAEDLPSHE